jgi:hypothetical protein
MINLKPFEGKVCTILTVPTNRNFKEEAVAMGNPSLYPINLLDHFVGRIVQIDSAGVLLEHPIIGTKSYFRLNHIIGIIEEQELDRNDPENIKIIEQIKQKNAPIPQAKVACPNGHTANVPNDIPSGSEVVCPICHVEFIANRTPGGWIASKEKPAPKNDSELVDLDMLNKLAQEAKKVNQAAT